MYYVHKEVHIVNNDEKVTLCAKMIARFEGNMYNPL